MFASHFRYLTRRPDTAQRVAPSGSRRRRFDDHAELTIRVAPSPERAIEELAELDGRVLPAGPRLVAELGGRPIAALALADSTAVADPMRPSAAFVELLRVRARQLQPAG